MASTIFMNTVASSAVATLPVSTKRTVRYVFDTSATKRDLTIPYAVVVNDAQTAEFQKKRPRHVSGNHGVIEVEAFPGDTVALHLSSDAHKDYRKMPVYKVTVGDHHVEVKIKEKTGQLAMDDSIGQPVTDAALSLDRYQASLTGKVWMRVSHKYDEDEADALLPAGARPEVKAAVKSIYAGEGLAQSQLTIDVPATPGKVASKLVVTFGGAGNPSANIPSFNLRKDGLPRVHPLAYAAVFEAALAVGAPTLTLSSQWRPCLGSFFHRAGVGLDVDKVGSHKMNRQELVDDDPEKDTSNVSEKEKELFGDFMEKRKKEEAAAKEAKLKKSAAGKAKSDAAKARKTADKAKKAYGLVEKNAKKGPPAKTAWDEAETKASEAAGKRDEAEKARQDAEKALEEATKRRKDAEKAWCDERDANEPSMVRAFRASLAANPGVYQIFDPWLMDGNTHDGVAATSNLQRKAANGGESNETLHAHHLHVTAYEPEILFAQH